MPVPPISITTFGGEIPAVDDRLLPENAAASAINAWLFSGRIEPMHSLQALKVVAPTTRSFFRWPIGSPDIDRMVDSKWLEFENENVRVIRSPTFGQTDERFYWADGTQPMMTTAERIENDDPPLKLGVPAPDVAPAVVADTGVSTVNTTVTYVYTWVTSLGEESSPSPPTTLTGKVDDIYHVTLTAPAPGDTAGRDLTQVRLYRTVVSAQGTTAFFFVAEQDIADLTIDDNHATNPDSAIVANEQLRTVFWAEPPADLEGLVTMANGMVAGWRKNEVWFCEPYFPHAWPVQYTIAVDANIVGLGVFNQSLIILTEGQPYAATGIQPGFMSLSKIQPLEPCTSTLSIVNTPNGVLYCSPNGLINITPAGAVNLTADMILKDQWGQLMNLSTVMATIISRGYYAYAGPTEGVFQQDAFQEDAFQQESHFGTLDGVYISLTSQRLSLTVLDPSPSEVQNVIQDLYNGETMVLRDGVIYLVDLRKLAPMAPYKWRSRIITLPYLQNMGAAKVYWTPALADPPPGITFFRMYAGGHAEAASDGLPLKFQQQMTKPGQMFRLPSGFKAQYYQFEIEGYLVVNAIHCAQTPHELRAI